MYSCIIVLLPIDYDHGRQCASYDAD